MSLYAATVTTHTITLIPGDGLGPEVAAATQRVLDAAGVRIDWEVHDAGAAVAEKRGTTLPPEVLESIRKNKVALKGPIGTPIGKGFRSVNVTLRQALDLYANVRPVRSMPGVEPRFEGTDMVIVRENTEDLYAGLELMLMPGIAQSIKLITEKGCTRICEYAFEYAMRMGRKRVTVVHKANIMKLSDGMFLEVFRKMSLRYPRIEPAEMIVDACAMQMVKDANKLDVVVTENLYGDILSDLGAGLCGGLGIVPGANIGEAGAVFEAVHGTAPGIAGKDVANPTALVLSAVMMLRFIGAFAAADAVENAVLVTLESHVHTSDIARVGTAVGTVAFTDAVIANLGRRSRTFVPRAHQPIRIPALPDSPGGAAPARRAVVGADIFVESSTTVDALGTALEQAVAGSAVSLQMIANRGTQLWPRHAGETDVVDSWRCRFVPAAGELTDAHLIDLLQRVGVRHRWTHVEKLNQFDGVNGFTETQGAA